MGGSRTGTPMIVTLVRHICRVYGRFGAADLAAKTTPEFAAAVATLVAACAVFEALDDQPYQIDNTAPRGPGDLGA